MIFQCRWHNLARILGPDSGYMDSYTRYVFRQLFVGMILVTAGLTCVIWLSQSLRFVELIVNRGVSVGTFVYMTMLLLPNFITIILPIALFTVVVFVYSKMVTDRELVVMRAAGVGQFGLAKPALVIAGISVVFGYFLNTYLLPESYRAFRVLQWEALNTYAHGHVLLKEGSFNQLNTEVTAYIRERTSDNQLMGILVHDKSEPTAPETIMAERGALVNTEQGPRVVMYNGNRQVINENDRLSILYFDRYVFEIPATTETFSDRVLDPRERGTFELLNMDSRPDNVPERDWGKFVVELHKRATLPLMGLGFAIVGLACILYGPITRRSQTARIITAVSIMVILQGSALGLFNIVAKNLSLVPLFYILAIVPILVGLYALTWHPKMPKAAKNPASIGPKAA